MLFLENSPKDLICRGFSRDEIQNLINVDTGYNHAKYKTVLSGINRESYKAEYVLNKFTKDEILKVLDEYGNGMSKEDVLRSLNLRGFNIIKLKDLFKLLDLEDEFKEADKAYRKLNMKLGAVEKFGTDNVFNLDKFQEKAKVTRLEKYGAEYTLMSGSKLEQQARKTFEENMKDEDFRNRISEKKKATNLERYGVEYATQNEDIKARVEKTFIKKYGMHPSKLLKNRKQKREYMLKNGLKINKKTVETSMKKYGVPYYSQTLEFREAQSERMLDKSYFDNTIKTKKKNNTLNTSKAEDLFKTMLDCDYETEYISDEYPYHSDFYLKDRDLYIELNCHWTHGTHFYDENDSIDKEKLDFWKSKNNKFYNKAIDVWTKYDVNKRITAKKNDLNYITFWDKNLEDAQLWFAMGMPDAKDYKREYSWLDIRKIEENPDISGLDIKFSNITSIVKDAQRKVFYKKELELWNKNKHRINKWGTVQAFVFANRYKYLGKLPNELSDREILRAFRISGLYYGYSSFDTKLMRDFIDKYKIKSIYDPCSGWGERMTLAAMLGVSYEGNDINTELKKGYKKLKNKFENFDYKQHFNDAALQDVENDIDAIITCPPYMSLEKYTEKGAENLDKDDFKKWWDEVVKRCSNSNAKYFAVQTNQKCRKVFYDRLINNGWTLEEELFFNKKSESHFIKNRKKEFESMIIFSR